MSVSIHIYMSVYIFVSVYAKKSVMLNQNIMTGRRAEHGLIINLQHRSSRYIDKIILDYTIWIILYINIPKIH